MKKDMDGALIDLHVEKAVGVPLTIAQNAKALSKKLGLSGRKKRNVNSFEEKDSVWAVFDRDEHPNFKDAVSLCKEGGIGIGLSDPCFELWLVLHYEQCDAPIERQDVQRRLEVLNGDYDRGSRKVPDCNSLMPLIENAESNAEILVRRRKEEGSPLGNPCSTVYELTREIRQAAEAFRR